MSALAIRHPVHCCYTMLTLGMLAASIGCQQSTTPTTAAASQEKTAAKVEAVDPAKLLEQMVASYQQAASYEDAGELFIIAEGEGGQKEESPPIQFSVAFERPNKIRVHSLGASVVADGQKLRAVVEGLSDQVLVLPCPEKLTAEAFDSDEILAASMRGQLGVGLPQVALLLDPDPLKVLADGGHPTLLEDAVCQGEKCHRVAIKGMHDQSIFWIAPETHLLMKYEFPSDAFKEKFGLAKCAIWTEMKGARTPKSIVATAFEMEIPASAKLLKRFLPPPPAPPSPLLAKAVEDFTFVDLQGKSVTRDSLKGKIVVLDFWATWCGWCFKGFPNLEEVYTKYKDNDRIVILAVNKDEPMVSDAQVRKSFEDAKLNIPIVRDQKQVTDKLFEIQGLPTMVILGADLTLEDQHVGYDAQLAETLPKKLERLLAGESLAKEELEKYQDELKKYEQQVSEALVAGAAAPAEEVARH